MTKTKINKRRFMRLLLTLALMIGGSFASAHGEEEVGPHGGEIRMPGAFHTEVLVVGKNKLRIYLLDLHFQKPTTEDSSVEVSHVGPQRSKAECVNDKEAFVCSFGDGVDLTGRGVLEVRAVYRKQKGNKVVYSIPLKF